MSNLRTLDEMNNERKKNEKPDTGEEVMVGRGLVQKIPLRQNPFDTDRLILMAEHEKIGFIRLAEGDVHTKLEVKPSD